MTDFAKLLKTLEDDPNALQRINKMNSDIYLEVKLRQVLACESIAVSLSRLVNAYEKAQSDGAFLIEQSRRMMTDLETKLAEEK